MRNAWVGGTSLRKRAQKNLPKSPRLDSDEPAAAIRRSGKALMPSTASSSRPPAVVLDTNAVLDWLVFAHPSCAAWSAAFAARRARWIASQAMRSELAHVLQRGALQAWSPQPERVWGAWERLY